MAKMSHRTARRTVESPARKALARLASRGENNDRQKVVAVMERTATKTTASTVDPTAERREVEARRIAAAAQSTKSIVVIQRVAAMVTTTATEDIRIQRRSLVASAVAHRKARARTRLDQRPLFRLQVVERSLASVTRRRPSRKSRRAESRPSNSRRRMAEQCSLLQPTTRYTFLNTFLSNQITTNLFHPPQNIYSEKKQSH